jgi:hypothetical protein
VSLWLPPLSAADPHLLDSLQQAGWLNETNATDP